MEFNFFLWAVVEHQKQKVFAPLAEFDSYEKLLETLEEELPEEYQGDLYIDDMPKEEFKRLTDFLHQHQWLELSTIGDCSIIFKKPNIIITPGWNHNLNFPKKGETND